MVKRNLKTVLAMLLVFIMAVAVTGCGNSNGDTDQNPNAQTSGQSEENVEDTDQNAGDSDDTGESQEKDSSDHGKILIAYFSYSGNTKKIAEEIQSKTGGELFEIRTVNEYSSDYNTVLNEAKAELDDDARPELSDKIDNMEQYQTVIIGYPIWWGETPKIMYTFVESYDLSEKIIIPFCTSASSGIGNSATNLQAADPSQATWLTGRRFSGSSPKSEVGSWISGLGLQ